MVGVPERPAVSSSFWALFIILFIGFTTTSEINIPITNTMQENTNIVPNISIFVWLICVFITWCNSCDVTCSEEPINILDWFYFSYG